MRAAGAVSGLAQSGLFLLVAFAGCLAPSHEATDTNTPPVNEWTFDFDDFVGDTLLLELTPLAGAFSVAVSGVFDVQDGMLAGTAERPSNLCYVVGPVGDETLYVESANGLVAEVGPVGVSQAQASTQGQLYSLQYRAGGSDDMDPFLFRVSLKDKDSWVDRGQTDFVLSLNGPVKARIIPADPLDFACVSDFERIPGSTNIIVGFAPDGQAIWSRGGTISGTATKTCVATLQIPHVLRYDLAIGNNGQWENFNGTTAQGSLAIERAIAPGTYEIAVNEVLAAYEEAGTHTSFLFVLLCAE